MEEAMVKVEAWLDVYVLVVEFGAFFGAVFGDGASWAVCEFGRVFVGVWRRSAHDTTRLVSDRYVYCFERLF